MLELADRLRLGRSDKYYRTSSSLVTYKGIKVLYFKDEAKLRIITEIYLT